MAQNPSSPVSGAVAQRRAGSRRRSRLDDSAKRRVGAGRHGRRQGRAGTDRGRRAGQQPGHGFRGPRRLPIRLRLRSGCQSASRPCARRWPRNRAAQAPKGPQDYRQLLDDKSMDAVIVATPGPLARAWPRSTPARRARTCTSRSRPATTAGKAARWSRRHASTSASCRSALRTAAPPTTRPPASTSPTASWAKCTSAAFTTRRSGPISRCSRTAPAARLRLGPLERACARSPLQSTLRQQLASFLAVLQRRHHQRRHPPDRLGPVRARRGLSPSRSIQPAHATNRGRPSRRTRRSPSTSSTEMTVTFELTLFTPYMLKISPIIRQATDKFPYWPQCATRIEIYGTEGADVPGPARRRLAGVRPARAAERRRQGPAERPVPGPGAQGELPPVHPLAADGPTRTSRKGHRSVLWAHYATISYRLGGQKLLIDPQTEQIVGNADAMKLFRREYRQTYEIPDIV